MARLVCFAGLPGVGKNAIARALARRTGALWLHIDSIEQALKGSHMQFTDIADGGYAAAYAVAGDALTQGIDVIADSVNPLPVTREAWRAVSRRTGAIHWDVEIVCSDPAVHRRRVESRRPEIAGLRLPGWDEVRLRPYRPWDADLRVDSAAIGVDAAVTEILEGTEWQG